MPSFPCCLQSCESQVPALLLPKELECLWKCLLRLLEFWQPNVKTFQIRRQLSEFPHQFIALFLKRWLAVYAQSRTSSSHQDQAEGARLLTAQKRPFLQRNLFGADQSQQLAVPPSVKTCLAHEYMFHALRVGLTVPWALGPISPMQNYTRLGRWKFWAARFPKRPL